MIKTLVLGLYVFSSLASATPLVVQGRLRPDPVRVQMEMSRKISRCAAFYSLESMVVGMPSDAKTYLVESAKLLQSLASQLYNVEFAGVNYHITFDEFLNKAAESNSIIGVYRDEAATCVNLVLELHGKD